MIGRYEQIEEIMDLTRQVLRQNRKLMDQVLGDKVTSFEYLVLKFLHEKEKPQPVTAISQELSCFPSLITATVDKLIKRKYVTRERSQLDRRVVEIELTPEGKQAVEETKKKMMDLLLQELQSVSEDDLETLCRLLRGLLSFTNSFKLM